MTTPRRRIVRPAAPAVPQPDARRLQRLGANLERERAALARWTARLKRAFNAFLKAQQRVTRLERQLATTEDHHGPDHRGGRFADGRDDRADEGVRRR